MIGRGWLTLASNFTFAAAINKASLLLLVLLGLPLGALSRACEGPVLAGSPSFAENSFLSRPWEFRQHIIISCSSIIWRFFTIAVTIVTASVAISISIATVAISIVIPLVVVTIAIAPVAISVVVSLVAVAIVIALS